MTEEAKERQGQATGGMSHRTATWLAWSMCAVCVALIALALVPHFLDFVTPESIVLPLAGRPSSGFAVLTGVLSLAYPMVGALIASRLPSALSEQVVSDELQ